MPINIHDEVMAPTIPTLAARTKAVVDEVITEQRKLVSLIGMDWATGMKTWADKG